MIGIAGFAKFWNLPEFATSLQSWDLFPAGVKKPAILIVPATEVAIALVWFGRKGEIWCIIALIALLVLYTAALATQIIYGSQPDCGCFGLWLEWQREQSGAWLGVYRNLIMIAVMIMSWSFWRPRSWRRSIRQCAGETRDDVKGIHTH
jgi:hypothetical protein